MKFNEKNIIITGGAGFIGSHLARRLVSEGANVTLVDSFIPEYGANMENLHGIEDKVRLNIMDIRDPYAMKHLIKGQDYLFNLAGQTSHMDSMSAPLVDLDINASAQLSILESCRHFNPTIRIVFAGTRQIYGRPDYLPVDEKHPIRPVDINGIHKLAGECYHLLYRQVYGIRSTMLRLTNTYGPCMRIKDASQTFVGIWIRNILEGKPFEVWGGEQQRDFTYVEDCVDAMCFAALNENAIGQIYNIGADQHISLKELADLLIMANGGGEYSIRQFPEDRKKIDIGDYYCDDKKIRSEIGWKPKVSLENGLKISIEYFRQRLNKYV